MLSNKNITLYMWMIIIEGEGDITLKFSFQQCIKMELKHSDIVN